MISNSFSTLSAPASRPDGLLGPSDERDALPGGQPRCVLLVEDDELMVHLVRFVLEREGYEVVHAADGREALTRVDTMPPADLVILDVMLPFIGGMELIPLIRQRMPWRDTPILMLTSLGADQNIARALDSGADDYVVKPFKVNELKARIRRLIKGGR